VGTHELHARDHRGDHQLLLVPDGENRLVGSCAEEGAPAEHDQMITGTDRISGLEVALACCGLTSGVPDLCARVWGRIVAYVRYRWSFWDAPGCGWAARCSVSSQALGSSRRVSFWSAEVGWHLLTDDF